MSALVLSLGAVAIPLCTMVGVLFGCIGSAWLRREELRTAQRGVDEARAMLCAATGTTTVFDAVEHLTSAGLWPPAPASAEPLTADPFDVTEGR
jgi:hypothetical protein